MHDGESIQLTDLHLAIVLLDVFEQDPFGVSVKGPAVDVVSRETLAECLTGVSPILESRSPFLFVYGRPFHGDPEGILLEYI
ncbi:MAG: hypothetical protein AAGA03_16805, partial [Planctomycetota bacterium]